MKTIIYISFLFLTKFLFAQEIVVEKTVEDSIFYDFQLTEQQYAAWNKIKLDWQTKELTKIMKEYKLKKGCGGVSNNECDAFYVDVILKINEKGKLEYYKLIRGNKCWQEITKPFEIRMMRNFFELEYPQELKNNTFQTRLGFVLKC